MSIHDFTSQMTKNAESNTLFKALHQITKTQDPLSVLKFQDEPWLPWSAEMVSQAPEAAATTA